jgi:hypothetical protein
MHWHFWAVHAVSAFGMELPLQGTLNTGDEF